jgi:hypothetical protein
MKRLLALVMAVLFMVGQASVARAFTFDAKKVTASVEYQNLDKDIDSVGAAASYNQSWTDTSDGDSTWMYSLSGNLAYQVSDVNMKGMLANIGYNLSDTLKPYILLGTTDLDFTQKLSGSLSENDDGDINGGSMDLLSSHFDSQLFTYGFGAEGTLMDFSKLNDKGVSDGKGIKIGYDARYFMGAQGQNDAMVVAPNDWGYMIDNKTKASFNEMDLSLIASKAFAMKKVVKEITPFVGYKYSKVNLKIKNDANIPLKYHEGKHGIYQEGINVSEEQNFTSGTHNMLVGVGAKITDNWSASVGAVIGQDKGFVAKATYAF